MAHLTIDRGLKIADAIPCAAIVAIWAIALGRILCAKIRTRPIFRPTMKPCWVRFSTA
jgi:hypothetical protein